jgi:hypothetical protein
MVTVTFEVFHNDFEDGLDPCFSIETDINHVPRVGEKIYLPEAANNLIELGLLDSRAFFIVDDIVNSILILSDGTSKNLVTCNLSVVI